ncbi:thiamine pyrophosphate-binding protein [Nitratireductor indicus]|uniref:thiamine pyrophosphate-binding protein n=1 Tax=Nitratireductor indicus TaxID=721133 RepID=UPI00059267FB|nr:thiamine pyrophosphate-binding protein [Nitratireductor indicus]SFQ61528.1 acetolactate synthase-1/2/3 large subunit [Nitratireductor indicus]
MTVKSANGGTRGGDLLVSSLRAQGVERVFCVPGESYLPVLDALHDARGEIDLVVCRQEGGAANMADAYGKLTGRPGVCFVTRGPGATNASIGVHTAFQDSTPMVLFVGQVGSDIKDREGFQEVDFRAMFSPLAKWAAEISDPARIPEYVHRAFQTAMAGRPGPVVLALPEDVLSGVVAGDVSPGRPAQLVPAAPLGDRIARLQEMVEAAERPLMIIGGGGWSQEAGRATETFAERFGVGIVASLRCQDYVSNSHPHYIGHLAIGADPKLVKHLKEADLLIVLGSRLGEMTTAGYTLVQPPQPSVKMIHVYPDPEELGRVYQADLPINAATGETAKVLSQLTPGREKKSSWLAECRADYEASLQPVERGLKLDLADVIVKMRSRLPADTVVTNGAGNYTGWVHVYWPFETYRSQLAPTSGAMGYGVPAAVAAKLTFPERMVVAFAGDGCFLMNGQELATAVQYNAKVLFIVVNNGMYGTIRMHQERDFPHRISGTDLVNPDFAALARAYGLHGEQVETIEDFDAALERALAADTAALIELKVDPEAISVRSTITKLREAKR